MRAQPNTKLSMNRLLACLAGLLLAGLASCEKKASALPPPPPRLTVTPVAQQDVLVMRTWVGLLNGYKNADIRAQVAGYLMTQDYKEGSLVKKGAVLFTIDKRPFQAALAQAQANPEWRSTVRRMLDDPDLNIIPRPGVYQVAIDVQPCDPL